MKFASAFFCGTLALLPTAWSQNEGAHVAEIPATESPQPTASPLHALFRELVEQAQQITHLLSEVADKESADRIAAPLKEKLTLLDAKLQSLKTYPLDNEQDAEAIKMHMATLTHVSQNTLDILQRLAEMNAYGSEALMAVFNSYKVSAEKIPHLQAEDVPHTQLYNDLSDHLDDALYTLRKVQDEVSSHTALDALRPLLAKMEQAHHMLVQLAPPLTDEQREAVRPARERLLMLSNELKELIARLQAVHCYRNTELDALLPRLLQAASS